MKVLTYNVCGFRYGFDAVAEALAREACDVAGLQEVPTVRGSDEAVYEVAAGASVVTAEASQGIGNSLLIRGPHGRARRASLWSSTGPARSAVMAPLASDVGRVTVCCVHLDDRGESRRLAQLESLDASLGSREAIVLGDFNALRESDYEPGRWLEIERARREAGLQPARGDVMEYIDRAGWVDLVRLWHAGGHGRYAASLRDPLPRRLTETSRHGTRVDYVFATPGIARKIAVRSCRVAGWHGSDHQPVVVDLGPLPAPAATRRRPARRADGASGAEDGRPRAR